ncbi:MAG: glycosyltransferase, partial [Propionivibrio sp.]
MNTLPTSVSDRAPCTEKPSISCIVPALNEYDNLLLLLPSLAELLAGISSAWEILLVDDGSKDA